MGKIWPAKSRCGVAVGVHSRGHGNVDQLLRKGAHPVQNRRQRVDTGFEAWYVARTTYGHLSTPPYRPHPTRHARPPTKRRKARPHTDHQRRQFRQDGKRPAKSSAGIPHAPLENSGQHGHGAQVATCPGCCQTQSQTLIVACNIAQHCYGRTPAHALTSTSSRRRSQTASSASTSAPHTSTAAQHSPAATAAAAAFVPSASQLLF